MKRKILNPITRIEGHLSIAARVEDGRVAGVQVRGEMYRGFENIMQGRPPLDAARILQRICGVCHEVHGVAAARALAGLYGVTPPRNGLLLHDIILALHMAADHMLHFYHLSVPDYVDFAALAAYKGPDPQLKEARDWVRNNKPVLFAEKVPGDYITQPKEALPFLVHYIEALQILGMAGSGLAVLGGKAPFCHSVFPGGVSTEITIDKLAKVSEIVDRLYSFAVTAYLPDVMSLAGRFPSYFKTGRGYRNLICYGGFKSLGRALYEPGVIIDGKNAPLEVEKIVEHVSHSYYQGEARHFKQGETRPMYGKEGAYSWIKAPRYDGHPMETGPLSRVYVNLNRDDRLVRYLKELRRPKEAAFSTMGRHIARAVEALQLLEFLQEAIPAVDPRESTIHTVDLASPVSGEGLGLSNAARGELLHYVSAKGGRVTRYQCVVPSTWNFSPRDDAGRPGPAEKAIMGTPVAFESGMIEVGRVVRSFDPCLACSIH